MPLDSFPVLVLWTFSFRSLKLFRIFEGMNSLRDFPDSDRLGDSSPKSTVKAVLAPPSGIFDDGGWTPSDVDFSGLEGLSRLSLETEELDDILCRSAAGVVVLSVVGGYVLLNGKSLGGFGASVN